MPHCLLILANHLKDFVGILVLDILHDAKSRSSLYGAKLSSFTDLVGATLILHNPEIQFDETIVNIFFFQLTLQYFLHLWEHNIGALGLTSVPDFTRTDPNYWNNLRQMVTIPFLNVADRYSECTFAPLNNGRPSAESYNYSFQRSKLREQHNETFTFMSPFGMETPDDFHIQLRGITDLIKNRLQDARVVLDMKTAAGLLRAVTDPIGYINNIATNCDPGRDMPGMKAIRQHAKKMGDEPFHYIIKIETPFGGKLTFLEAEYTHTLNPNGSRGSVVTILNNQFKGRLPRSIEMSEALNFYLGARPIDLTISLGDMIEDIYENIKDLHNVVEEKPLHQFFNGATKDDLVRFLRGTPIDLFDCERVATWILRAPTHSQYVARINYVSKTIQNITRYSQEISTIVPENIISELIRLMVAYRSGEASIYALGFCYHQLNLLNVYINYPDNPERYRLLNAIESATFPSGNRGARCKLGVQIVNSVRDELSVDPVREFRFWTDPYLNAFFQVCKNNVVAFSKIDDPQAMFDFLCKLPHFNPPPGLRELLMKRTILLSPKYISKRAEPEILLCALLEVCGYLTTIDLRTNVILRYQPLDGERRLIAIHQTLGKFSGDFGQILWAFFHGQIFATEDNNASAMALFIQRLNTQQKWATIHGLGDGSAVEVTITK